MPTAKDAVASIQTRMESFIEAARVIANEQVPSVKINLDGVSDRFLSTENLQELERKINEVGIKEALSKHMKKFNDALIKAMESQIPSLEGVSSKKIFKELMDAENHLNMGTRAPIVSVEDKDGNLVGRSNPNGGFQVLVGGEWKDVSTKEAMLDLIGVKEGSPIFVREENPITKFTNEQTAEWLSILGGKKPEWFSDLPDWEQKYLSGKVQAWKDGGSVGNLGDHLGSIPSTIRKYPGAPNAYVTSVDVRKAGPDGEVTTSRIFEKVRSGAVIAFDLEEPDRTRLTQQNLEQLMADTIQRKLDEAKARGESGDVSIPMAIQTLFSPPFQPDGGDGALAAAVDNIKKQIGENSTGFLKKIGVEPPDGIIPTLNIDYSNIPVNKARGIASLVSGRSSSSAGMLSACASSNPELAKDATRMLSQGAWHDESLFGSLAAAVTSNKYNHNSERAALEQILNFAQGGNRIGSCVSGKDREEMVTEMAVAMVMFRETHGHLPPPPGLDKKSCAKLDPPINYEEYKSQREQFEGLVARQFLSNHGQQIAAANSKGSDGLKNVDEVYGKAICSKIKEMAKADAGKAGIEAIDPLKETKARAGLNKPKISKTIGAKIKGFFKKAAMVIGAIILSPILLIGAAIAAGVDAHKRSKAGKEIGKIVPDTIVPAPSRVDPPGVGASSNLREEARSLSYGEHNDLAFGSSAPAAVSGLPKVVRTPEAPTPLAEIGRAEPDPEHGLSMGVEEPRRPASSAPAVTKGPSAR